METERSLWLIDAGYMINAQRSVPGDYQFDYRKLKSRIEETETVWRTYFLNSTPNPPSDRQDTFHTWMRSAPPHGPGIITNLYKLKTVRADSGYCEQCARPVGLRCIQCQGDKVVKRQQKGVDVGIATLALIHQEKYSTLILSSGDGDLLDAVEFLSERGKRFVLVVFQYGVSAELQARADDVIWIDDFAQDVVRDR